MKVKLGIRDEKLTSSPLPPPKGETLILYKKLFRRTLKTSPFGGGTRGRIIQKTYSDLTKMLLPSMSTEKQKPLLFQKLQLSILFSMRQLESFLFE